MLLYTCQEENTSTKERENKKMTMNLNGYKVNNVSKNAATKKYIVVRYVDDSIWFYGAYNDKEQASLVADFCGGWYIENKG